jgi:hypothetical protein
MIALPLTRADEAIKVRRSSNVAFWQILLQKSKIERCRKSRESGFLDTSTAAIPRSADAKVRGHFCAKQLGPSHRLIRNASAVPGNFDRRPKKTFATISALLRHADRP